jgi:hypothetical protein
MEMNILKPLAVAAISIAMFAPAKADKNKQLKASEILGEWCFRGDHEGKQFYLDCDKDEDRSDGWLTFRPKEVVGHEHGCRYVSVREWKDMNKPLATKVMGAPTAEITANCSGEGCQWRERIIVYYSKTSLVVSRKRIGKEVCRG